MYNSKLTDYYVNTTFKTNISTDFTLLLKMSNNRKNIDTKLIEYGNYKVIYNYIGVPEPEVIVTDKTTSALDFEDGKYVIPNLDVNSRYDIIFRDKTKKIKDQISNYRKPMKY